MVVSNIRDAATFKQTVLIVDSQQTILDTHSAIMRSLNLNLNIIALTRADAAMEWTQKKQVDLIITGLNIAPTNALQLLDSINRANSDRPVPIIVISALGDTHTRKQFIAAGASAYLTKPAKTKELSSLAYFLLSKRKQLFKSNIKTSKLKACY